MLGLSRRRRQEKHSRDLARFDPTAAEQRIYDLVRERMMKAVGPGAIWSVSFRDGDDGDGFFSETLAEILARDIASQITGQNYSPFASAVEPVAERIASTRPAHEPAAA